MTHPLRFSDDDPVLAWLRPRALSFPGATEKVGHGRHTWRTTRQQACLLARSRESSLPEH